MTALLPLRLQRTLGWEEALERCILAARMTPFAWGSADCLVFALDAIRALTGWDLRAQVKVPWYVTPFQAQSILHQQGLFARVSAVLGPSVLSPQLRRGDLVWDPHAHPGGVIPGALGVCLGEYTGWRSADRGLVETLTYRYREGWHVG